MANGDIMGNRNEAVQVSAVDRLARRIALSVLPVFIVQSLLCLGALTFLVLHVPRQYGGAGILAMLGLTLIAAATEVFLGIRLYGALRKPRHQSGPLVGRPWPMLAFARLGCVVLVAIGLGLLTPMAVHLGLPMAMAATAVLAWLLLHAATRGALGLGNPALRLAEDGAWVKGLDGEVIPWSRFSRLSQMRTPLSTRWVLVAEEAGKTDVDQAARARMVLSPMGLDLTHGDLLRALARLQPRLVSPYLS